MPYEREFKPNYSPIPLVVFDFQVVAHDIHKYLESYDYITNSDPMHFTQLIKAAWAYRLNYGIDTIAEPLEKFTAIVVNDNKGEVPIECAEATVGYWRHIVAYELGLQEYKIGRKCKPDSFNLVCQIGLAYIMSENSTFYYYEQLYMEADDIAGKLARIKRSQPRDSVAAQRQMLLYTVDGDWQGLVSDEHNIVWCNTGPWIPRMRNDAEVIDYYYRKLGKVITKSRECYELKATHGDLGDGLLPGSPLRLFDLYNEDHEYNFSEGTSDYLTNVLNSMKNSKKIEHLQNSSNFFKKFGLVPPVLGFPSDEEFDFYKSKAESERTTAKYRGVSPAIRKICREYEITEPEVVQPCIDLGKQDETVRLNLKEQESLPPEPDLLSRKQQQKAISALKTLRKNLKSSAESLTSA